ncbi:hypothetical protein DPMN_095863 [Dreissena polymorpha]|uniref:Uncharacterized protein n=1 Tax=Dreissena polymorpha TaxID=45954 RepID=A0A9D4L878_DREPO|nr:hypothetical protein DPMN_095863 [Dreissena polymorpha]
MNLLTKFHEDWTINVASRVHVFQAKVTIFKLIQDIIGINLLAKFHEDRKINVASRVLTRKNAPAPGGHVFQPTGIIFELFQDIIGMNLLTKFHEDWTINVTSRVKNAPPLGSYFHEDRKINVDSKVLTRKKSPPPGSHVFQPASIIFKLVQDIIGMNLLTKFHEDQTMNVASRVKNAPPLGSHVFQANVTIFELNRHIQKTHVLTKFHEDWTKNVTSRVFTCFHYIHIEKTAPPPGGHVFSPILAICELVRDIYETNVSTKFHDEWAKIVTSRVYIRNTAPPPDGHTNILTNFELSRGINGTNVLTKFHEDRTINVAS